MTPYERILGTNGNVVNFAANAQVTQQPQDNYAYDSFEIRLTGNLTLASYSTPPSKFVESLENLISTYSLVAVGNNANQLTDTFCNVDAAFLRFKTRIMEGTDVTRTDIGTANGTYAFETNFKRYFADPRSDKPILTRLHTALLSTLSANFQFRDQTAMVYGGVGGTATLSNVQVTTQGRGILGAMPPQPTPYVKEAQRLSPLIQNSQNGLRVTGGPRGLNTVLRRQYFKGIVGQTTFADPSDSVFGATGKQEGPHVGLQLNNTVNRLDQVYAQMRANNKVLFGIESMPAGYAVFEPAYKSRKLNQSIPLAGVSSTDNLFDVTYNPGSQNFIQITDETIIGVSPAQWMA